VPASERIGAGPEEDGAAGAGSLRRGALDAAFDAPGALEALAVRDTRGGGRDRRVGQNSGKLLLRGIARDGAVIVTCQDSGLGMTPDVLARIFDPFFTTKGRHGTGLGLPIVKDVVVRHGGEVRVASEPGAGTTFTLLLPAAEPTADLAESVAFRAATADDLATCSILVVEDDPVFRAVFSRRLALDARRVDAVSDAASAIRALATDDWDLVCIDDGLPDQAGRELAAEIHRLQPDAP